jgi:uncharacterized protein
MSTTQAQPLAGEATAPRRPAPIVTEDSAFFWDAAAEQRLVAQQCGQCGRLRHPPRPMCPHCHSLAIDVIELSGRGSLYSYALLHHPRHPAFDYPIIAALVDLEEGIRLVSDLVEIEPEAVHIGMPLEVLYVPTESGASIPVFQPAGS